MAFHPLREQIADPNIAEVNRDYPWMAGFDAIVDEHYFTDGQISKDQAAYEVGIFACSRCAEHSAVKGVERFAKGCPDSWNVIAKENFGSRIYAISTLVEPFMSGAEAASSVLDFAREEARV